MQHVLLTGATGFLGSHLLEALLADGYEVTILKRSTSDTWRIAHLLSSVEAYDVDEVAIEKVFSEQNVEAVVHTACNYGRHGQATHEVVESNVLFGLKLLGAAISNKVSTFINTDTLLPKWLNAYSLSKSQFSEWLRQCQNGIQVVNFRLEHMYGPKDDATKFVPWLISQLDSNVDRISLTKGTQLRDFIYVDDVVSAYLLALKKAPEMAAYSEYDVGTGELTSVRAFVTNIYDLYNYRKQAARSELGFGDIPLREGEDISVKVDNSALRRLGWNPQTSNQQGIEKLLNWFDRQ